MRARPHALVWDAVSEGTALGGEPEAYFVIVYKEGVRLFQHRFPNPDYVAPPEPTALEQAKAEWAAARAARAEAIDAELHAFRELMRLQAES